MNITDSLKTDLFHSKDMGKNSRGDLATVSGLANFKLALFHRLVTVPGSLVHRPLYGVGVGRFQNGLSSFAKQQKLASLIREQFKQDPRVQSISSIAVIANDENPQLTVIRVSVIPVGYTEQTIEYTPFNSGSVI